MGRKNLYSTIEEKQKVKHEYDRGYSKGKYHRQSGQKPNYNEEQQMNEKVTDYIAGYVKGYFRDDVKKRKNASPAPRKKKEKTSHQKSTSSTEVKKESTVEHTCTQSIPIIDQVDEVAYSHPGADNQPVNNSNTIDNENLSNVYNCAKYLQRCVELIADKQNLPPQITCCIKLLNTLFFSFMPEIEREIIVIAENSAEEETKETTKETGSISVAAADHEYLISTNDIIQDQQIAVVATNDSNIQAETITIFATDDYAACHINEGQRIVIVSNNNNGSEVLGANNVFDETNYREKIILSKTTDNFDGERTCLEDNKNEAIIISAIQESDIDDQLFNTFIDANIDVDILNASDTNSNEYCQDNHDYDHIIDTQSIETIDTLMDRDYGDENSIQEKSIENIPSFCSNETNTTNPFLTATGIMKSNDDALTDNSPETELPDRLTTKEIIDSFEI